MKVLTLNKSIFKWLCIYPFESGASILKKNSSVIFVVLVISIEITSLKLSFLFICENAKTDFSNSLYAFIQMAGFICVISTLTVAYISRHELVNVIVIMQGIYNGELKIFSLDLSFSSGNDINF